MRIKRKVVKVVKPKVVKAAVAKKAGLMRARPPKRGPVSAKVDTAFAAIIEQALHRASKMKASNYDYQAGLRYMRDEIDREIRASDELPVNAEDDY